MQKCEQLFIDIHADKNKTYIHHPQWFYFKNGLRYMPDFYCKDDNEYIEISGTRQAYHANKYKYALMITEYGNIKFRVVHLWTNSNIPIPTLKMLAKSNIKHRIMQKEKQKTYGRCKLSTYMNKHNISVAKMAALVGITKRSLYLYRSGSRIPSGSTIKRIVAATNGKVKAEDLL